MMVHICISYVVSYVFSKKIGNEYQLLHFYFAILNINPNEREYKELKIPYKYF